ncbi:hypothetical protein BDP27DRAFT_420727 [Rhodocollybia butyracea]|uniref:Uncharacterized protein n=1 Tax=Rhodocollybia butyracea TaxID=206335 RepID=A0A9P5TZ31_9AGAR|nr:hypothetical protein BDP27DRAFT_420727 [Rhodocollybia butyracea]
MIQLQPPPLQPILLPPSPRNRRHPHLPKSPGTPSLVLPKTKKLKLNIDLPPTVAALVHLANGLHSHQPLPRNAPSMNDREALAATERAPEMRRTMGSNISFVFQRTWGGSLTRYPNERREFSKTLLGMGVLFLLLRYGKRCQSPRSRRSALVEFDAYRDAGWIGIGRFPMWALLPPPPLPLRLPPPPPLQ